METLLRLYWRQKFSRHQLVATAMRVAVLFSLIGRGLRKGILAFVKTLYFQPLRRRVAPGRPMVEIERNYEVELKLRGY